MNPVTRGLLKRFRHQRLHQFVARWDALEALIIRVYKDSAVSLQDQSEYLRLQRWLRKEYPRWQQALRQHWREVRIKDEFLTEDPFLALLAPQSVDAFVDNWAALQTLPAAREALNNYLLKRPQ